MNGIVDNDGEQSEILVTAPSGAVTLSRKQYKYVQPSKPAVEFALMCKEIVLKSTGLSQKMVAVFDKAVSRNKQLVDAHGTYIYETVIEDLSTQGKRNEDILIFCKKMGENNYPPSLKILPTIIEAHLFLIEMTMKQPRICIFHFKRLQWLWNEICTTNRQTLALAHQILPICVKLPKNGGFQTAALIYNTLITANASNHSLPAPDTALIVTLLKLMSNLVTDGTHALITHGVKARSGITQEFLDAIIIHYSKATKVREKIKFFYYAAGGYNLPMLLPPQRPSKEMIANMDAFRSKKIKITCESLDIIFRTLLKRRRYVLAQRVIANLETTGELPGLVDTINARLIVKAHCDSRDMTAAKEFIEKFVVANANQGGSTELTSKEHREALRDDLMTIIALHIFEKKVKGHDKNLWLNHVFTICDNLETKFEVTRKNWAMLTIEESICIANILLNVCKLSSITHEQQDPRLVVVAARTIIAGEDFLKRLANLDPLARDEFFNSCEAVLRAACTPVTLDFLTKKPLLINSVEMKSVTTLDVQRWTLLAGKIFRRNKNEE
ncbi:hypothetical protein HK100_002343 [Physocladia obscura]|uniref:Uncharacterized protein n=1 Tax=Physocladia obscura TaxID=109957 RepID=A0AAD5SVH9_9FUNG|nr:hypothetical protein HK100_002343 [Physocladia obscura]